MNGTYQGCQKHVLVGSRSYMTTAALMDLLCWRQVSFIKVYLWESDGKMGYCINVENALLFWK